MKCCVCNVELTDETKHIFTEFNKVNLENEINHNNIICDICLEKEKLLLNQENTEDNLDDLGNNPNKNLIGEIIIPNDLFNIFIGSVFQNKLNNNELQDDDQNTNNKFINKKFTPPAKLRSKAQKK